MDTARPSAAIKILIPMSELSQDHGAFRVSLLNFGRVSSQSDATRGREVYLARMKCRETFLARMKGIKEDKAKNRVCIHPMYPLHPG